MATDQLIASKRRAERTAVLAGSVLLAFIPLACNGDPASTPAPDPLAMSGAHSATGGAAAGGSGRSGAANAGSESGGRGGESLTGGSSGSSGAFGTDDAGFGGTLAGEAGRTDDAGGAGRAGDTGNAGSTSGSANGGGAASGAGNAGSANAAGGHSAGSGDAASGAGGFDDGGEAGNAGSAGSALSPVSVAVIGASSAAGKNLPEGGFSLADSWVNRYAAYLGAARPGSQITNLAVSGYGTFHALPTGTQNPSGEPAVDPAHNITAALATNPDAIIVSFPSQSLITMGRTDEVLANLHAIADEAAESGVPVWITTTQPNENTATSSPAQIAARDRVLDDFGARALDFWTPLADSGGLVVPEYLNAYDGVHPSAEGHRVLFEAVVAADIPGALGF